MFIQPHNRLLAVSQKIYGWLLHAYPRAHREAYGAAMAQLFCDQCRDAWEQAQGRGMLKLWLRVVPDLVSTSIAEQLSAVNPRKSMPTKLAGLTRQSTPLSVFAAVFTIVFLMVFAISTIITFILPESYASTARLKLERDSDLQSGQGQPTFSDPYFIQTTFEIIQSELVLGNVVASQDLNRVWGKKYNRGEPFKTAESIQILKSQMALTPVRNTKLIAITVYNSDKNEASNLANAIAQAYQTYCVQTRAEQTEAMHRQYANDTLQISQLETKVNSLNSQLNIASPSTASPSVERKLLESDQKKLERLMSQQLALQTEYAYPSSDMAQITDTATPGLYPVKPNKPLNIALGTIIGIFLAAIVGAIAMLVAFLFKKKTPVVAPA